MRKKWNQAIKFLENTNTQTESQEKKNCSLIKYSEEYQITATISQI